MLERLPHTTVGEEITQLCKEYEKTHVTFIDLCGQKLTDAKKAFCHGKGSMSWGNWLRENTPLARAAADRIIESFKVRAKLFPIGERLPTNESQYRALAKIDDDKILEKVWKKVSSGDSQVTAKAIETEVSRLTVKAKTTEGPVKPQSTKGSNAGASESEHPEKTSDSVSPEDAQDDSGDEVEVEEVESVADELGKPGDASTAIPAVVLGKIIQLIQSLDEDGQKDVWDMLSQEDELIDRLAGSVPATADELVDQVSRLMSVLPTAEKKVARKDLVEIYGDEKSKKLQLPDDHIEACKFVGDIAKEAFGQLCSGFEEWDKNGRRKQGRTLRTAIQRQLKNFTNAAMLDEEEKTLFTTKFPERLSQPEFMSLWDDEWIPHRKQRKESISETVQNKQLNCLNHFDVEQATEIVTKAMERGWNGIPDYGQLTNKEYGDGLWCGRKPAYPRVENKNTNGAFFKEVWAFAKRELSPTMPYEKEVKSEFGDRADRVLKAIRQVKIAAFLKGGRDVEEVFQEIMGEG